MCKGCFGGFCGGVGRRVRGAFRSIRARLVRRNLRHVDGERQGGTHNTAGCPDDGMPSSKQTVRHEHFFPAELTETTSVQERKKTIKRNGKYKAVSQSPSLSRQEAPSERTSLSQPPSGSSPQDSSHLERLLSSSGTTPHRGNIVSSSSQSSLPSVSRQQDSSHLERLLSSSGTTPLLGNIVSPYSQSSLPSVSGQQDSSFCMEYAKAMMLTQDAIAHMKKTGKFDYITRGLLMKAYENYKKAQTVNQSNRESGNSRVSATSKESTAIKDPATSRVSAPSRVLSTSRKAVSSYKFCDNNARNWITVAEGGYWIFLALSSATSSSALSV